MKLTHYLHLFCFGVIALINPYISFAQLNTELSIQQIEDNIFQSSVREIYEDSYGFLWIGTTNGLYKYDGTNFQLFGKTDNGKTGLTNTNIYDIVETENQNLLIATDYGLSTYDRTLDIVKPYYFEGNAEILNTLHLKSIYKQDNFLWVGTFKNGLYKYNMDSGSLEQLLFNKDATNKYLENSVFKLKPIDQEHMLLITKNSVVIIDSDLNIISAVSEDAQLRSITKVEKKAYLMGNQVGEIIQIKIEDDYTINRKHIPISPGYAIPSILQDNEKNIWIGTENNGLFVYSSEFNRLQHIINNPKSPKVLPNNSIWSLYETKNNTVWIGTFKNGMAFYDSKYHKFQHIKNQPYNENSLSNNIVTSFLENENETIWIATDGGGINLWDRTRNTFQRYSLDDGNFNSNVALCLLKNGDELWVGTWGKGLTIFNTKTKEYKVLTMENSFLHTNDIMGLLKDESGRIWIASWFGGIHIYDPNTDTYENLDIKTEVDASLATTIYQLKQDTEGNVWAGSQAEGLFKITEKNDGWEWQQYHSSSKTRNISNDFINDIYEDKEGTIWVATQEGLNKYDATKDSFSTFGKAEGLLNESIKALEKDEKGWLWLSTDNGLSRYNPVTHENRQYDTHHGLQGKVFNSGSSYETVSGDFIFGGSKGFNIFDPSTIQNSEHTPMVYFSDLKIFNETVKPKDKFNVIDRHISQLDSLAFHYKHSVVSLNFNAITFRHPEHVKYAYYLEGFEETWNYVNNQNYATYTNLDPDEYIFHVKASNSDGVWSDNSKKLHITIIPPFWMTWWFRITVLAAIVGIVYLLYYLRMRSLKRYQVKLERKIAERTQELRRQKERLQDVANELSVKNEEIQRFAFSVSHDLKSPLASIQGFMSLFPIQFPVEDFPDMKEYVDLINISCETMEGLIADITKIAQLGKIENQNEVLDTDNIMKLARTLVSGKLNTKNVTLTIPSNLPKIYGDKNRIIQVFSNLIDNAIKYMGEQKKPKVSLSVTNSGGYNHFSITDNGSGMDERALKKLFSPFVRFHSTVKGTGLGLYMTKQMVTAHGGDITATSKGKGKGATFTVTLPEYDPKKPQAVVEEVKEELVLAD
ncbi:two-component regulator propeller domain-containing protein [Maribacter sp. 2210JD10-5]|uniref:two-component regulator propeller domain-containing protein n=1 Tax=Maribacter sp. 2210JD10-5 TaxID=3386272 RepID=UPI0039BCB458